MLQVLSVWLYMGVTCWILGYGALSFLANRKCFATTKGAYRVRHRLSCLLTGVVCASMYAQIFSLFAPVGAKAQVLLPVLCALIVWCCRRQLLAGLMARAGFAGLKAARRRLPDGYLLTHRIWLFYVLLVLGMAYGASHGIMHYDTGLYHAQSIRFIEEYGVVRGLANLHSRLGYNSASFAFSALYSFSFAGGRSLHAGAGFFALLLSFACLDIKHILRRGRPVLTDFVRFAGLYYLFNIYKEMVSPAPDYFLNTFLFCLLILWVELDVRHERHYLPYALLTAGFCFAVTIKLSAAPLLLLAVKPIVLIVSDAKKRARQQSGGFRGVRKRGYKRRALCLIAAFAGLTFAVALPWFIRNALISGWVLYPSTLPDVIRSAWKVPHDLAEGDAAGIRAYARGTTENASFRTWFSPWFFSQSLVSRIFLVADFCALFGFAAYLIVFVLIVYRRYRKKLTRRNLRVVGKLAPVLKISRYYLLHNSDFLFLEGVLLLSFLFWFLQAPLIRYGFFFVWTPPVLLGGRVFLLSFHRLTERRSAQLTEILAFLLLVFLLYKGVRLVQTDVTLMHARYLTAQQDYERYEVIPYEVDGVTFYYPAEGDRTGYDGFPGGDHKAAIRLLGKDLKDGIAAARE